MTAGHPGYLAVSSHLGVAVKRAGFSPSGSAGTRPAPALGCGRQRGHAAVGPSVLLQGLCPCGHSTEPGVPAENAPLSRAADPHDPAPIQPWQSRNATFISLGLEEHPTGPKGEPEPSAVQLVSLRLFEPQSQRTAPGAV